jgi:hypothetical protein
VVAAEGAVVAECTQVVPAQAEAAVRPLAAERALALEPVAVVAPNLEMAAAQTPDLLAVAAAHSRFPPTNLVWLEAVLALPQARCQQTPRA